MDYQSFQSGGQNQNQIPSSLVSENLKTQNLSERLRPYQWRIAIVGGIVIALLFGAYRYLQYSSEQNDIAIARQAEDAQKQIEEIREKRIQNLTVDWKIYTNTRYGFEFKYPENYVISGEFTNTEQSGDFLVTIRPNNWLETRIYDITSPMDVAIYENPYQGGSVEHIMAHMGFKLLSDGTYGIRDLNTKTIRPATEINVQDWKGLRGVSSIAVSSINNNLDVSAIDNLRAFLGRDSFYFASFMMYPIISEKIFDQIISTFKFIEPVACIQVITPARNSQTGEVRDFPTPCDVPEGWSRLSP